MIIGDLRTKTELNEVNKYILHKYNLKQIYNYNGEFTEHFIRLLDN